MVAVHGEVKSEPDRDIDASAWKIQGELQRFFTVSFKYPGPLLITEAFASERATLNFDEGFVIYSFFYSN
jgi:hypothetical protein